MEELQAKHRKEQRDLQSRVTQKKKTATKKTRKGVNDECAALEAELKQKQEAELAELDTSADDANEKDTTTALEQLDVESDGSEKGGKTPPNNAKQPPAAEPPSPGPTSTPSQQQEQQQQQQRKPNRQKARLARRAAEQTELAARAASEAQNLPDLKQQERSKLLAEFTKRGLQEKVIRADGHCLYSAVADQLQQLEIGLGGKVVGVGEKSPEVAAYRIVRARAAAYIEQHAPDFEPFLEEPLAEYVRKVRETGEWGGQLELLALANCYGVEIDVVQGDGRVERIEPGGDGEGLGLGERKLWLGYYKHGFGLGEHYNSLRKAP